MDRRTEPARVRTRLTVPSWLFTVTFVLTVTSSAMAFDIYPEFHVLSEEEQAEFDRAYFVDAEYQSDVTTYAMPYSWDPEYFAQSKVFQGALGSLSNKIFLQHTRLRLHHDLRSRTQFRLTHFQQRDLDVDQTHMILELVQKLKSWLSVSVYGEPSHRKRENDFGLALLFYPTLNHEIRFFHTWVDFTRNRHNDREDFFLENRDPKSAGIVGRCSACFGFNEDFLEYFIRYETPVQWRFPQSDTEYGYENRAFGANARWTANAGESFTTVRAQHTRKFEGLTATGTSTLVSDSLSSERAEFQLGHEFARREIAGQSVAFEPVIGWHHRKWRNDANETLEHRNLVLTLWSHWPLNEDPDGTDRIDLGYDATIFSSNGDASFRPPELKTTSTEHRLNLRYALSLSADSELSLMGSADADESLTFEGGHGMLKMRF